MTSLSSDEESPQVIHRFRYSDLPNISIPSPFQTEDSSSEFDTAFTSDSVSRTSPPSTPGTPSGTLETAFSFARLSSQTSEEDVFVTPSNPKRKKYTKKRLQQFQKGHVPHLRTNTECSGHERVKVTRPKSALFNHTRFPREDKTFLVKLCTGVVSCKGESDCKFGDLSEVLSLLFCTNKTCKGAHSCPEYQIQLVKNGREN